MRNNLEQIGELDIDKFKHVSTSTWNSHAPIKKENCKGQQCSIYEPKLV